MTNSNPLLRLPKSTREGASAFGVHFTSEFQTCETKWWNKNLRPHPNGGVGVEPTRKSAPLLVGSAYHEGLAAWYLSGWRDGEDTGERSFEAMLEAARDTWKKSTVGAELDERAAKEWAQCEELLVKYHAHYGPSGPEDEFQGPLQLRVAGDSDGLPLVEREFAVDLDFRNYYFTARLDLVAHTRDGLMSVEHKSSAATKAGSVLSRFDLDGQGTGQRIMLGAHFPEVSIGGIMVSVGVKDRGAKSNLPTFMRKIVDRSAAAQEKFVLDLRRKLYKIDEATAHYQDLTRAGMSTDEAARVAFDGSPDGYRCHGDFKCEFFDLCANRDISDSIVKSMFVPRAYDHYWENPLAILGAVKVEGSAQTQAEL